MFPQRQRSPHGSWAEEVQRLNSYFGIGQRYPFTNLQRTAMRMSWAVSLEITGISISLHQSQSHDLIRLFRLLRPRLASTQPLKMKLSKSS